jgi:hypothetical protein
VKVRSTILPVIDEAVSFLLRNQDDDGAWRDFQVKKGRSDAWSTAYIAMKLHWAQQASSNSGIEAGLHRAARFLASARKTDGWGYNNHCNADADATAHVILFLQAIGYGVCLSDYAALAKFQVPSGGFATYKMRNKGHGWGWSHPDVTAVALRALCHILDGGHDILRRGLTSLVTHLNGSHASESYWWPSPFYLATQVWMLGQAFPDARSLRLAAIPSGPQRGNFDVALALDLAVMQGGSPERIGTLRNRLLAQVYEDGSWPSGPILRITDPRARDFGDELFAASPIATDDRQLFTTATVLGALVRSETVNADFAFRSCRNHQVTVA